MTRDELKRLTDMVPEERHIGWYKWFGFTPAQLPKPIRDLLPYKRSKLMGDDGRFYRTETQARAALTEAVEAYRTTNHGA